MIKDQLLAAIGTARGNCERIATSDGSAKLIAHAWQACNRLEFQHNTIADSRFPLPGDDDFRQELVSSEDRDDIVRLVSVALDSAPQTSSIDGVHDYIQVVDQLIRLVPGG